MEIPLQMMRTIVEIGRREKINTSLCLLSDFMLNQFRFFPIFDFLARKITEKENSNLMVIVILEVYICNLILFISFRRFLLFWFDKFCYSVFFLAKQILGDQILIFSFSLSGATTKTIVLIDFNTCFVSQKKGLKKGNMITLTNIRIQNG